MNPRESGKTQNALEIKMRYVKHHYSFIEWDGPRFCKTISQLVSVLLDPYQAKELELQIREKTPVENQAAIVVFASTSARNKSRIVVTLEKLTLPTLTHKQMLIIAAFLNNAHCPPEKIWNACASENITLKKQWEVANDHLVLAVPSCTYINESGTTGRIIKKWLLHNLRTEKHTSSFMQNFESSLIIENHKYKSYHMFQFDSFVCEDLLKIATDHHKKKMQQYVSPIVSAAFNKSKNLPIELSPSIGFFLASNDARQLAMINKSSAQAGNDLFNAEKKALSAFPGI